MGLLYRIVLKSCPQSTAKAGSRASLSGTSQCLAYWSLSSRFEGKPMASQASWSPNVPQGSLSVLFAVVPNRSKPKEYDRNES